MAGSFELGFTRAACNRFPTTGFRILGSYGNLQGFRQLALRCIGFPIDRSNRSRPNRK